MPIFLDSTVTTRARRVRRRRRVALVVVILAIVLLAASTGRAQQPGHAPAPHIPAFGAARLAPLAPGPPAISSGRDAVGAAGGIAALIVILALLALRRRSGSHDTVSPPNSGLGLRVTPPLPAQPAGSGAPRLEACHDTLAAQYATAKDGQREHGAGKATSPARPSPERQARGGSWSELTRAEAHALRRSAPLKPSGDRARWSDDDSRGGVDRELDRHESPPVLDRY